jgi:hypothetical protein
MITNGEYLRIQMETIVVYLTVLFQDSSAEIKTIKPSIRIAGNTAEI